AVAPDSVYIDRAYDAAFTRSKGWTGADGAYSWPLPDGRVLWLFSDTLVGDVADGRRKLDARLPASWGGVKMLNNSYAIQSSSDPESLKFPLTVEGGAFKNLFKPLTGGGAVWVNGVEEKDGRLTILLNQFVESDDPRFSIGRMAGLWAATMEMNGDTLAVSDMRELRTPAVRPGVPGEKEAEIVWGAGTYSDATHTYMFNAVVSQADRSQRKLLLSRAPRGEMDTPEAWEFHGPGGWNADAQKAELIDVGMANEVSVHKLGDRLLLVSQTAFGEVQLHGAPRPEGPWTKPTTVYNTPELGGPGGQDITYHAKAHPHLSDSTGLLVGYNVNSLDIDRSLHEAAVYRPRFIRVPWSKVHAAQEGLPETWTARPGNGGAETTRLGEALSRLFSER
ncbi:MAG: DUF5005 domain-containing protein, partial [Myxococcota bacterium]